MLSRWPIRNKLLIGLALLIVMVTTALGSGLYGLYAYRSWVKSLSSRANELPLATTLIKQVGDLRLAISDARGWESSAAHLPDSNSKYDDELRRELSRQLAAIGQTLDSYRVQLEFNERLEARINAGQHERQTFEAVSAAYARLVAGSRDPNWVRAADKISALARESANLQNLAAELPAYLHENMRQLASHVRGQYRSLIWLSWATSIAGGLMLALFVKLFYDWIFRPLRVLIKGSRKVAGGQFSFRIHLESHDEMAELADAMNDMTERFQAIRDDLDRQVQERTKQVVRSEQLASVGFLAAGVAHEINNPLASIAMCAESLEGRLHGVLDQNDPQQAVVRQYLRMIQDEAFRCKEITEKLLDFSRLGDVQHQEVELRELVQGVIDMVAHLGKYQDKRIELLAGPWVRARVNAQEIKQVVLNLLTNGLDSLDPGGVVRVELAERGSRVELVITDNGCGMTADVLKHLFEPFFTRRRGGQGTGLGLSISYRIIADHDGQIEAHSEGPGQGSQFRVTLPRITKTEEMHHQQQAA